MTKRTDVSGAVDLHIYLPADLIAEIKRIAAIECRSIPKQVEWLVREGLQSASRDARITRHIESPF